MSLRLAQRMENLGTETAFEVLARARRLEAQGRHIVHLEIGEPDFPTPQNIVEAAEAAIGNGYTHYTPAGGLMPARQAVAEWIRRTYEVEVAPEQVVMVPGSKNVLLFTMLSLIDDGSEAIVRTPAIRSTPPWPSWRAEGRCPSRFGNATSSGWTWKSSRARSAHGHA